MRVFQRWTAQAVDGDARTLVHWHLLALALVAFCVLLVAPSIDRVRQSDVMVVVLIGLNAGVALYALTYSSVVDGVSLRLVFWFYNLFFLAIVPLAQYLTGVNWIFQTSRSSILEGAAYVLVYQAVFLAVYPRGAALARRASTANAQPMCGIVSHRMCIAAALSAGVAVSLALQTGYTGYGSLFGDVLGNTGMRGYAAGFVLRPATFFLLPIAFLWWRAAAQKREQHLAVGLLAAAGAIVFSSPLGGTRFYVFAVWFGLFVTVFPPGARHRPIYLMLLIGGLLGGHVIRLISDWLFFGREMSFSVATYLYQGHFDGFENFVHGVDFVAERGITWGRQLLGAVLFWVPRSLWADKPIGTAAFVASSYLAEREQIASTNLASPFIEEAYVNFHIPGVVLFTGLLALAFGYLDLRYRAHLADFRQSVQSGGFTATRTTARFLVLYPIVVGLSLFWLRGDMLSAVAYSSAIAVTYELVTRFVFRPGAASVAA